MGVPADLDHLVFACSDLDSGIAWAERTLGVRPSRGGTHPQWGTHNALLSLGRGRYLELLAPDPGAAAAGRANEGGRALFGLDAAALAPAGREPRLTAWMTRSRTIETLLGNALRAGCDLGRVHAGSRLRADGTEISWQIAVPPVRPLGGCAPWLIDWGWSEHPSAALATGARLDWLEVIHPEPARVRAVLEAVNCPGVEVREGPEPRVSAGIACARGVVVV
jgi:catechol 2,3-dioxygenase-like lactoylglutathione lyase family enzyme